MGNLINLKLKNFIKKRQCTLLGVGPMSKNCVDAAIELSNDFEVPIMLIASRRQIDSDQFGGGYVNNWSTPKYAEYVFSKDKKGKIILCRDHGGPWQSLVEVNKNMGLKEAMQSAKDSYTEDIKSGFEILHIDPSIDIHTKPSQEEILERVFELYEYCWIESEKYKKEITFEVGTEEQSGMTNSQEELDYTLEKIRKFCKSNKLPIPLFVVIQSGTKVLEMENVGSFDTPIRKVNEIPVEIQLPKVIEICHKHEVLMKEHNCDYLSDESLEWHPRLGIHASNVAPEFGVAESKALLKLLTENNLNSIKEEIMKISYESKKWEKWLKTNSLKTDQEKSILCMHYVFSNPEVKRLKEKAKKELESKSIFLDDYLKESIKKSITKYLYNFNIIQ